MFSEFNLYHADITGVPHLHIFAERWDVAEVLVKAYSLIHNLGDRKYDIGLADPMNLSRKEREHLHTALAQHVTGLGVYAEDDGWEVFSVFDYKS